MQHSSKQMQMATEMTQDHSTKEADAHKPATAWTFMNFWTLVWVAARELGDPMTEEDWEAGAMEGSEELDSDNESFQGRQTANRKRKAEEQTDNQSAKKKTKATPEAKRTAPKAASSPKQPTPHRTGAACTNCGAVVSPQWRNIEIGGDQTMHVCNACGIYWGRHKRLRAVRH